MPNLGCTPVNESPDNNGDFYTAYAELKREFPGGAPHHFLLSAHSIHEDEALLILDEAIAKQWAEYEIIEYYF